MLVPEITHRRHGGGGPENSPFRASSVGLSDRTAGVCELQRWPHDLRAGGQATSATQESKRADAHGPGAGPLRGLPAPRTPASARRSMHDVPTTYPTH